MFYLFMRRLESYYVNIEPVLSIFVGYKLCLEVGTYLSINYNK